MRTVRISSALVLFATCLAVADPFPATLAADGWDGTPDLVATPNSNNDGVPDLYTEINRFVGTTYINNEPLDARWMQPNDLFTTGAGGSSTVAMVGLTAGYSNTLGWYPAGSPLIQNDLILNQSGFGNTNGPVASFSTSSQFGFYLRSNTGSGTNTFFSEPSLNTDQLDHLVTYRVSELDGQTVLGHTFQTAYLMGWEDILGGGDQDYDDMMYLMDVRPAQVPEPASLGLLGIGLLALAGARRRKN